jgi:hypothetical protein
LVTAIDACQHGSAAPEPLPRVDHATQPAPIKPFITARRATGATDKEAADSRVVLAIERVYNELCHCERVVPSWRAN